MVKKRKPGRPRILKKSRLSKKLLDSFKVTGPRVPKPLSEDVIALAKKQFDVGPRCDICKTLLRSGNHTIDMPSPRCSLHEAKQAIGDPYAFQKEDL